MAAFAALFALGARWDAEPAPWYVRIAGALLFGVGLVLVAAESGNAIGACGGRPAGESTAMDGEPER